jgi:hypothetical protein
MSSNFPQGRKISRHMFLHLRRGAKLPGGSLATHFEPDLPCGERYGGGRGLGPVKLLNPTVKSCMILGEALSSDSNSLF